MLLTMLMGIIDPPSEILIQRLSKNLLSI
jgi:hypothetical protein